MSTPSSTNHTNIGRLLEIMEKLRSPDGGCPWDLEQNFQTIAPYTIEEAYEVADAIEKNDMGALKDELGDLLFQVVFHAQIAKEESKFEFADIVTAISDKMVRRHPHVFEDAEMRSAAEQTLAWEDQKAKERENKCEQSLLADVPAGLPGLARAVKLQKRAARVGFDWTEASDILDKLQEETQELQTAISQEDKDHIEEELGDLLFVLANLGRRLDIDPDKALRRTNEKFIRRFTYLEDKISDQGRDIKTASLAEMEGLWTEAKQLEKKT